MVKKETKVLVVDDEKLVCDFLYDALADWGYKCITVPNGRSALQELEKHKFDIILLDIRLPGMSGMDILQEIWLNHVDIPTIMITAVNDVDTAVQAMKMGAANYIVKPLDMDKVAISIETALKTKRAAPKTSPDMDAIARGVEASLDPSSARRKEVTQRTTEIARQLGITEKEIQRWAEAKVKLDSRASKLVEPV